MSEKEFPHIPGYEIEKILGKGGMGVVYLAVQTALDRKVALKVTLAALAELDSSFTKRFVQEAKATAALKHSNIITVFDAGVYKNSSYMAMEYISTGTLVDLEDANLSQEKICKLFIGIGRGLGSAHRAGFVHRDIKPDNILIDANGNPLVTDFGIVKALDTKTALTRTGGTIGTPQYMSPEQIKAEEVDGRSDLYSLGIMMFNLLEGHVPFTDEAASAVYIKHVTTKPPPLSRKNKAFQSLISRLLRKDPENRYKDADELVLALKAIHDKDLTNPLITGENEASISIAKPNPLITGENQGSVDKTQISNGLRKQITSEDTLVLFQENKNRTLKIVATAATLFVVLGYFAYSKYFNNETETKIVETPQIITPQKTDKVVNQNLQNKEDMLTKQDPTEKPNNTPETIETTVPNLSVVVGQEGQNKEDKLTKQGSDEKPKNITESIEITVPSLSVTEGQKTQNKESTENNDSITPVIDEGEPQITKNGLTVKPAETVEQNIPSEQSISSEQQINLLLASAQEDMNSWRLLRPENKSAYAKYIKVLNFEAENTLAKKGLLEIISKYDLLSQQKTKEKKFKSALDMIGTAINLREEYLNMGYDKDELLGISSSVLLNNLKAQKQKTTRLAKSYKPPQKQLAKNTNTKGVIENYNKGKAAYEKKNYTEAFKWLAQASQKENAAAEFLLGDLYYSGKGVKQSDSKALEWYQKSANQNYVDAQLALATMYQQGSGVAQNTATSMKWYEKAASQNNPKAQYELGLMAYKRGKKEPEQYKKALNWFEKAASLNDPWAQNKLGLMHKLGKGTPENIERALELFRKAAQQNIPEAQDNLGWVYFKGQGVKRDFEKSAEWYEKAANQNYADSQGVLGAMYEYGRGVRKNSSTAVMWYKLAAKQGDKFAIKKLKKRGITKFN